MGILIPFLIVIEVIVSVLLVGVVLLQKSREQGLGMAFGANVGESLFGSRAGNVLTKATIFLGSVFAANTLLLGILYAGRVGDSLVDQRLGGETGAPVTETAPWDPAEAGVTLDPDTGATPPDGLVDLTPREPPAAPDSAPATPDAEAPDAPPELPTEP